MKKIRTQKTNCFIFLLVVVFALTFVPVAQADNTQTLNNALGYLKTKQYSDGGFGETAGDFNSTAYTVMSIAAAGQDPNSWVKDGKTPVDFLEAQAPSLANESQLQTNTGKISWLILALVASDKDPRNFAGSDWLTKLNGAYDASTGKFGVPVTGGSNSWDSCNHIWAIFALKAAEETVPAEAVTWLKNHQNSNGSWSFDVSDTAGDTNSTALAIQVLISCGEASSSTVIQNAIAFLRTQQNNDGGFPFSMQWGDASDANSDAWVIQAIIAAGENPADSSWAKGEYNPLSDLLSFQNSSTGAFQVVAWGSTDRYDNLMATYQAVPALAGKTWPVSFPANSNQTPQNTAQGTGSTSQASAQTNSNGELPRTGRNEKPYLNVGYVLLALGLVLKVLAYCWDQHSKVLA